jgi:predicted aminopeptidase
MARLISMIEPLKRPKPRDGAATEGRRSTRWHAGQWGLFLLLLVLPLLWACNGAYLFHAASGQLQRITDDVPIEEALKDPSLGDRALAHLNMIGSLKHFAVERLGLSQTESYETVFLKPQTSYVYTVSASPKDRLSRVTWWFPVVGRVPYLGFFDLAKARAKGKRLAEDGMDVFISRAEAYSTLGWFDDPLTRNMIEASTVEFVETVIHEMTHSTLYLSSQPEFNETLASVVAKRGTVLFLEETYGAHHPWAIEAVHALEDERLFSDFLSGVLDRLSAVYDDAVSYEEKLARRTLVFSDARETLDHQMGRYRTDRFDPFLRMELNNASILALGLYHRYFNLLEATLHANRGAMRETIDYLRALSKTEPDLIKALQKGAEPLGVGNTSQSHNSSPAPG